MLFKVGDRIRSLDNTDLCRELRNLEGVVESATLEYISVRFPDHKVAGYPSDYVWTFYNGYGIHKVIAHIIIYPNQKCVECSFPAPHAKPNLTDDKYICSACKVMRELI